MRFETAAFLPTHIVVSRVRPINKATCPPRYSAEARARFEFTVHLAASNAEPADTANARNLAFKTTVGVVAAHAYSPASTKRRRIATSPKIAVLAIYARCDRNFAPSQVRAAACRAQAIVMRNP